MAQSTDIFVWQRVSAATRATFDDIANEIVRAKAKHGEFTPDGAKATDLLRLAALTEEFGEVGEMLTYDSPSGGRVSATMRKRLLRDELLQTAAVSAMWAAALIQVDDHG